MSVKVVALILDDGGTATLPDNPIAAWPRLLRAAENDRIQTIVIGEVDDTTSPPTILWERQYDATTVMPRGFGTAQS